jgi:hypothetical protein
LCPICRICRVCPHCFFWVSAIISLRGGKKYPANPVFTVILCIFSPGKYGKPAKRSENAGKKAPAARTFLWELGRTAPNGTLENAPHQFLGKISRNRAFSKAVNKTITKLLMLPLYNIFGGRAFAPLAIFVFFALFAFLSYFALFASFKQKKF